MKLVLSLISIAVFLCACHEETKTIIIKEKPIIIEEHRSHTRQERQERIIVESRERGHRHQAEAEINVTVPMPVPPMPPMPPPPSLPHIDMHVHN